jgi:hypothetical protein
MRKEPLLYWKQMYSTGTKKVAHDLRPIGGGDLTGLVRPLKSHANIAECIFKVVRSYVGKNFKQR